MKYSYNVEKQAIDAIIEAFKNGSIDNSNVKGRDDVHNKVFCEGYFIIGSWDAEQWILKNFDNSILSAIHFLRDSDIREYTSEKIRFNPEDIAAAVWDIAGNDVLSDLDFDDLLELKTELNDKHGAGLVLFPDLVNDFYNLRSNLLSEIELDNGDYCLTTLTLNSDKNGITFNLDGDIKELKCDLGEIIKRYEDDVTFDIERSTFSIDFDPCFSDSLDPILEFGSDVIYNLLAIDMKVD